MSILRQALGERLKEGEPLAKHVNIRIGGLADLYFEAKTSEEIARAIEAAFADGVPFVVIGGGSNSLPSDEGFRGLVIQAANRGWSVEGDRVRAEAGTLSGFLARKTAEAGLTGLEWAVSLPGTIGGAVRGNAGCFGGETKDAVASVEVLRLRDGKIERRTYAPEECAFGYRDSVFKRNSDVILAVEFRLARDAKEACLEKIDAVLSKRKAEQPNGNPSAGCMFKNFGFAHEGAIAKLKARLEVPAPFLAAKRIPAGWLIDQVDLKGKTIGGAQVSPKHGNFLVNLGDATASDVLQLISLVKMKVRDEYGIQLEEEVQMLGF